MTDKKLDQILQQTLSPKIEDSEWNSYMDQIMEEIDMKTKTKTKKIMTWKKGIVAAAVACLMVGTTTVAFQGKIDYWISKGIPKVYTSYEQVEKAEKAAGLDMKTIEKFQNGFTFQKIETLDFAGVDENDNVVVNNHELQITYQRQSGEQLYLYGEHAVFTEGEDLPEPVETKVFDGVEVNYYVYQYKFVPVDYELTEEDYRNMERKDYEISVGSDKVEYEQITSMCWEQDGIAYSIMDSGKKVSTEAQFQMAEELIQAQNE